MLCGISLERESQSLTPARASQGVSSQEQTQILTSGLEKLPGAGRSRGALVCGCAMSLPCAPADTHLQGTEGSRAMAAAGTGSPWPILSTVSCVCGTEQ